MKLEKLKLQYFRNYAQESFTFSNGINIMLGENAQGKTNLLEAIYLLTLARSHRTNKNGELIKWGKNYARVTGQISKRFGKTDVEMQFSKQGKKAKVNHIEQKKLSSYIGQLNVILFSPEDLLILKGSPALRRRFMDREFGQISYPYLYNIKLYNNILKQRNAYLRQLHNHQVNDLVYLGVLSEQLATIGAKVIQQRLDLLKKLEYWANKIQLHMSQNSEKLNLQYDTKLETKDLASIKTTKESLVHKYKIHQDNEIRLGTSLYGPHRDQLQFMVNNRDVKLFGSQGQQRTAILAVKLAEVDLMKEVVGEYPILLLDDVLSELDKKRQTDLLTSVQNKVQIFLTTTSLGDLNEKVIDNPRVFKIKDGKLIDSRDYIKVKK